MDTTQEKRNKKFNLIPILIFVFLFILESVIAGIFVDIFKEKYSYWISIAWMFSKLIPIAILLLIKRKEMVNYAPAKNTSFKKYFLFVLIGFAIFYIFQLGSSYYQLLMDKICNIGEATNQEAIYEYFDSSNNMLNYILLFVTIVILAPFLEEFEFRKLIYDSFDGFHYIVPLLISSLLFGFAHMASFTAQELLYLPLYFLPGFALALIYKLSNKNVYVTFAIHSISNFISFIAIINLI